VDLLLQQGIAPGITVDAGTTAMAGSPAERITDGLDGLRDQLEQCFALGARFAKWSAGFAVSDTLPSPRCLRMNAMAIARYAALCQAQGLVPVVDIDLSRDGDHGIERCEEASAQVLRAVFAEMHAENVLLEGMLLRTSMVLPGIDCAREATVPEIAAATLRCLRRHVPAAIPAIVFRSGGQDHVRATLHLGAINHMSARKPWVLSFAFRRALQDEALSIWQGIDGNRVAAQQAFFHRARCVSSAAVGRYTSAMESSTAVA
jgi:fructose-bisphosphate aldolase class I